jgi:hypothetical protein
MSMRHPFGGGALCLSVCRLCRGLCSRRGVSRHESLHLLFCPLTAAPVLSVAFAHFLLLLPALCLPCRLGRAIKPVPPDDLTGVVHLVQGRLDLIPVGLYVAGNLRGGEGGGLSKGAEDVLL